MVNAVGPSERLARHVAAIGFHDLPRTAVEAACDSLLDALGVSLAATALGEDCGPYLELAHAADGGRSLLLGSGRFAPAPLAALANGALAHALDYEDSYDGAPVHASAAVVPAALALAQQIGNISGQDLLTALAVASDLTCRLGLALTASPERLGWYPPPIFSTQGAATACARLLRLSPDGVINAWALALGQGACSTQFKQSPSSTLRAVRDAYSAQSGLQAAWLAGRGVRGFAEPLEGSAGLYAIYADGQFDPQRLVQSLGQVFEGARVSYKAYPSCRGTHAYIDAALELRAGGLRAEQVELVTLRGNSLMRMLAEPIERKRAPRTAIDAKFSAPYCFARALCDGHVDLDSFTASALVDPATLRLAARVDYQVDPAQSEAAIAAGCTIVRHSGGQEIIIMVEHPSGSPARPLTSAQKLDKFRHCASRAARVPSPAAIERIIEAVASLDRTPNLEDALFPALSY